jgi:RimJ/RimL family protein N-acetyltransferase
VGTVWIERESTECRTATLGIMIGREDKFGKGIGRKAIQAAIDQAKNRMSFKSVELNVRKKTRGQLHAINISILLLSGKE